MQFDARSVPSCLFASLSLKGGGGESSSVRTKQERENGSLDVGRYIYGKTKLLNISNL